MLVYVSEFILNSLFLSCAEDLCNSFIWPYVVLHTCVNVFVKSTMYNSEQDHHAKRRLENNGHEGYRT